MSLFLLGMAVCLALWFVLKVRVSAKALKAYNAIDAANEWFSEVNILPNTVRFNSYSDPRLTKHTNSQVLVGFGMSPNGERIGFAVEISDSSEVTEALVLSSPSIALKDKSLARSAKINDTSLMHEIRMAAGQKDVN